MARIFDIVKTFLCFSYFDLWFDLAPENVVRIFISALMFLFLTGCFAGNSPGDMPSDKNISLDLDAEEVIFRNLPTKFASAKTYKLMLQKGVSTKISAFLPGAPGARLELESLSGKKINLANQKSTDFLARSFCWRSPRFISSLIIRKILLL